MQFGFGVLRLSSSAFWAMTPRELAAAFAALNGARVAAPPRDRLERMMRDFPDGGRDG
jgi:uncharacterized phage protein (TIGR02216 family)